MKNKLGILFKTMFLNNYKIKTMSAKKWALVVFAAIYILGYLILSLGHFFTNLFETLTALNMSSYYLVILFSIASLFACVLSIFSAKSTLFNNKDNDLLLSMPIKRSEVLASRYLLLMVYNIVIGMMFIIPGLIVYFRLAEISIISIISIIFLIAFFAIIPTILSSLFACLIAFLTSKSNAKSMMELIYYTLFIFLYFIVFYNAEKIINSILKNVDLLNVILKTIFLPIYLIFKGITGNNLGYILLFLLFNLAMLIIFVLIFNRSYIHIIEKLNSHLTKSNFKMKHITSKSVQKALLQKELKKYFSSAIYVFNTIFGVAFIAIAGVLSLFYSFEKLNSIVEVKNDFTPFTLVFLAITFVISLTNTTNSSISIERDNFWILKVIPVKVKDIFQAKLNVNRLILIPVTILSLIMFKISGYINFGELLTLILFTISYGLFIANYGLIVNLLLPKLDAISDAAIVKQSAASFVGILGGFLMLGAFFAIVKIPSLSIKISLWICILISLVLYFASTMIINSWGEKRFNEIS